MKVYEFNWDTIRNLAANSRMIPEQLVLFRILRDGYYTQQALEDMGYKPKLIDTLVSRNFLVVKDYPEDSKRAAEAKEKEREERDARFGRRRNAELSREYAKDKKKEIEERRLALLRQVVLPYLVSREESGQEQLKISPGAIAYFIYDRWLESAEELFRMNSHEEFMRALSSDLAHWGFKVDLSRREKRELYKKIKEKTKSSPEYRQRFEKKIQDMLAKRAKIYPEDDSCKNSSANLAMRVAAYYSLEHPEEDISKKMCNSMSNFQIDKTRAKRRKDLLEKLVAPEFGNPEKAELSQVEALLADWYKPLKRKYYSGSNWEATLEQDLRALSRK